MRKSAQVCARITEQEMESMRQLASKQSILLSDFIRQALANEISRLAPEAAKNAQAAAALT